MNANALTHGATMRPTAKQLGKLIQELISGYTINHEALKVEVQELTTTVMISVRGSTDDHRRLVGSRGRHVWSLQRIAGLAGARIGKSVRLSLLDPVPGERGADLGFEPCEDWDSKPFLKTIKKVVDFTAPEGSKVAIANAGHNTTVEIKLTAIGAMFSEYAQAMQALFFAIGKMQGRIVELRFLGQEDREIEYAPL